MTRAEFKTKTFSECISQLIEEGQDVTTQETLKAFAIEEINNDRYFLAIHVLEALHEETTDFYIYDYNMGTLQTPSGVTEKSHIEHLIED